MPGVGPHLLLGAHQHINSSADIECKGGVQMQGHTHRAPGGVPGAGARQYTYRTQPVYSTRKQLNKYVW